MFQCSGCDKEVVDNDSVRPLLLATIWGRAEAVMTLAKRGCELNVTDKDGKSAVYWAAQEGHMDVLRVRYIYIIYIYGSGHGSYRNVSFCTTKVAVQSLKCLNHCETFG